MLVWYKLSLLVQTIWEDSLVSGRIYAGPGVTCPTVMQAHKTAQNSIACVLAKWTETRPQSHSRAPKMSVLCGQGAAAEGTVTTCQTVGWLDGSLWEAAVFGSSTSPPVKPISLCVCCGVKGAFCSKTLPIPTQEIIRVLWPGGVLSRKWVLPEHSCSSSWPAVHHVVSALFQ